ncbi:MAG: hypothetical protein QME88_11855 [Actinomycetota bacterium]|nr:hypothetical protein [Actinomycetota bacterium]
MLVLIKYASDNAIAAIQEGKHGNLAGEAESGGLKPRFDARLRLRSWGAKVTTDAGRLAVRELDEALGFTEMAGAMIQDG